jgi:hypothetical protein
MPENLFTSWSRVVFCRICNCILLMLLVLPDEYVFWSLFYILYSAEHIGCLVFLCQYFTTLFLRSLPVRNVNKHGTDSQQLQSCG